ncbi:HK97 gp10 family phage protein [Flavobacterium panici]|uniref:Uncharacterized protein n=1 Tax=Flavobacterium panici TaxID=2654843 RepID=A0A9N8P0E7_9FLAO|nr:HK97 gp10 family phage protein [Flavobacterium panici]CAC9972918.1 hypothetical protein FLAPXU55_00597 [Flavobacterium panici]
MLSDDEVRKIAQQIIDEAKAKAHVDQGTLKRSISYTVTNGKYIFRQMYYGFYGEDNPSGINSKLEQIARRLMPRGVEYQVIGTDFNGRIKERTVKKSGRTIEKSPTPALSNKQTTSNLKKLVETLKKLRKNDGDSEKTKN